MCFAVGFQKSHVLCNARCKKSMQMQPWFHWPTLFSRATHRRQSKRIQGENEEVNLQLRSDVLPIAILTWWAIKYSCYCSCVRLHGSWYKTKRQKECGLLISLMKMMKTKNDLFFISRSVDEQRQIGHLCISFSFNGNNCLDTQQFLQLSNKLLR
mmetsp:Transcript_1787/g.3771  ORF Transcript_1787/g.3771 Transcript_1787/m.3771 type:complete len:155 (+) Transcript_1787:1359-1823(+)